MNFLSVLITYHNEQGLLRECLESLIHQPNAPEEILIYDDASKFPAKDYVPLDSRIRIVRGEKNIGPSQGRNVLLKEAKGEYIHFHDADDWFHSHWCSKIREGLSSRNADAVYTEVESHFETGDVAHERVLGLETVTDHDSLIRFCLRNFMLVPAGTFRTGLIRRLGGYRPELWQSEDYEFNARVALELEMFEVIQEPLVCIRLREASRSRNRIETNTYALEAVMQLKSEVPRAYWGVLSDKAASIGRQLYQLGERRSARRAFRVARKLGPPKFSEEGVLYRYVARWLGQEMAERTGMVYRSRLPLIVRKLLHR